MKSTWNLQGKGVATPSGTFRNINGTFDAVNGIVWLDEIQLGTGGAGAPGKRVRPGIGIHLASRTSCVREKAAPAALPSGDETARLQAQIDREPKRGPGRPPKAPEPSAA